MPIERYHFFKLKPAFATTAGRRETRDRLLAVLPGLPGVRGVVAGIPADDEALAAWDVSLVVRFDDLAAAATYRAAPGHRRFVDEFMVPRLEVKKSWNFEVAAA
ncbi:MAG: Dabb family protein [bacterium]|nr:Dabb family protein [bacterium]